MRRDLSVRLLNAAALLSIVTGSLHATIPAPVPHPGDPNAPLGIVATIPAPVPHPGDPNAPLGLVSRLPLRLILMALFGFLLVGSAHAQGFTQAGSTVAILDIKHSLNVLLQVISISLP